MASIVLLDPQRGNTDIDYSMSGRIRSVDIYGEKLYDEETGLAVPNWRSRLQSFVVCHGLDKDDGRGLHAFIPGLMKD